MNGCWSSRLGYVDVGFEGNCDCRYGILYARGVVMQVILASSPFSSELLFPAGCKIVSPTHRPPLPLADILGTQY